MQPEGRPLTLKMGAGHFTHVEIRTQIRVELLLGSATVEDRTADGRGALPVYR